MAVEFFTGFEGCSSTGDVTSFMSDNRSTTYSATGGFDNGKCVRVAPWMVNGIGYFRIDCEPKTTIVVGFHSRGTNSQNFHLTDTYRQVVRFFMSGGNVIHLFNPSTGPEIYVNSTLVGSYGTQISSDLHHLELKVVSDATEGSVELKLNGVTIIEATDINTIGGTISQILWGGRGTGNRPYIDNIFVADDWAGELKSRLIIPSADDIVEFDPSTGVDNYALLETNDGDTSYVSSDVVDAKDMYEFGPNIVELVEIPAVSIVAVAKKDDVGVRELMVLMEQDAVEYELESKALSTTYPSTEGQGFIQTLPLAPDGNEWSPAIINALKAGFKVV